MIFANNPLLKSWIPVDSESDFPIQNLPFGIFSIDGKKRVGVAIGESVIDLSKLCELGLLKVKEVDDSAFQQDYLNPFMELGRACCGKVRNRVAELLQDKNVELANHPDRNEVVFLIRDVVMCMPVKVGDYTDFYSSVEHATNVGTMFRDPANALLPNWKHLPVGYHGRASSIILSGQDVIRPKGQTKSPEQSIPEFGPSKRVDFELEMAFITCKPTTLGDSISIENTEEHIFGFVLFNDWSARDIQTWEYVPLGPFLAKNFASSISPWVVTLDALEPFRVQGPEQDTKVLPYLEAGADKNFDINLEVSIEPQAGPETIVSRSNFKHMYWNINQQLAHHTVNGCNINVGDMYASGTISGPTPDSYGSMLELAWKGTKPIVLKDGSERKFIHDHDTVTMRGYCRNKDVRIGFGEVKAKLLPTT